MPKISELPVNSSPSTSATLAGVDNGETVQIPVSALGGGSGGIIDVTELPTENINEDAFYRLLTGTFVYNQFSQNNFTCYCVETLPEVGEPATTDMTTITAYYNVEDGMCYGYVDSALSSALGVPAGWYDVSMLLPVAGYAYGGVVTTLEEAILEDTFYLLLQYEIYSYKDGWTAFKSIGKNGTGVSAEVFNHPSNVASGDCSHAEGYSSHAEGYISHAEGYNSHAEGNHSHAEGYRTTASGQSQHVQGEYNIVDPDATDPNIRGKYAHIVGNGTDYANRSNAHTLDWDGNAWYAGDIYTGGTGQDDTNAKKMATEEYVDEKVGSISSGGSGGGGASIIDIEEFPSSPSTSAIYRKWQVIKAQIVQNGSIIDDGTQLCGVVDTLPEVGNVCYTGTTMYAYYNRADGESYGYVDSNLAAQMGVPAGWYPAATLFGALGYEYHGIIDSIDNAQASGRHILVTKKPHLYCYHNNGSAVEKAAIITNNNYEFDEETGTLTQHIIL